MSKKVACPKCGGTLLRVVQYKGFFANGARDESSDYVHYGCLSTHCHTSWDVPDVHGREVREVSNG